MFRFVGLMNGLYTNIMKHYDIQGHEVEINEQTIVVESDGIVAHPDRMTIDANINYVRADGNSDTDTIFDIPVDNLNYDKDSLFEKTMLRLNDFEI